MTAHSHAFRNLLVATAFCALVSLFVPWWYISMHAPQYPDGLRVSVSLFGVKGDVAEIDDLNHYIGFRPLDSVAAFERKIAWLAIPAALLPLLGAFAVRRKYAWLTTVPTALIAPFFVGDLATWMWYAGNHLDPHAALSNSISPWTPSFLGPGGVGQFKTFAMFDPGFLFAAAATICAIAIVVRTARTPRIAA
jgi:copper chaperone NosL